MQFDGKLIKMLEGSHAQAPKSFGELLHGTGLSADALNAELDKLYNSRLINQATVFRSSVPMRMVWLTLMSGTAQFRPWKQFDIKPPQAGRVSATPPTVKKDEPKMTDETIKTDAPATGDNSTGQDAYEIPAFLRKDAQAPIELATITAAEGEPTSKAWLVLKAIEAHPVIDMPTIRKITGVSDTYNFIKGYIQKGLVVVDKTGVLDTYALKEGMTAKDVHQVRYEKTFVKATTVKPQTSDVQLGKPHTADDVSEVPMNAPFKTLQPQPTPAPALNNGDKFRCAYTNDGCLIIYGVEMFPMELSPTETKTLIEFISDRIMPVAVEMQ